MSLFRLILDYDDTVYCEPVVADFKRSQSTDSATSVDHETSSVAPMIKFDHTLDNEDLFLLSFAPSMTRLTTKQNALARIRILEELFKLEFEDE